jgi:hypothetical protein
MAGRQGRPPTAPAAAAAGEQGKTERGARGFFRRVRRRARASSRSPAGSLRRPAMRRLGPVRVNLCRRVRPWTRPGVQARGRLWSAGGSDSSGRGGLMAPAASAGSGVRPGVGLRWREEAGDLAGVLRRERCRRAGPRSTAPGRLSGCWSGRAGGRRREGKEKKKGGKERRK